MRDAREASRNPLHNPPTDGLRRSIESLIAETNPDKERQRSRRPSACPGRAKTLETGCEIDFHFVDAATGEIGLSNYVYTLKKQ
jgi:hypothetical protein